MPLISPLNRARFHRLIRTFKEIHAETGSLRLSGLHMLRFIGKKLLPLIRYGSFTFLRLVMTIRLRRQNHKLAPTTPAMAIRILGGVGDYIVIARYIRDMTQAAEPLSFDLYSTKPRLAEWIFASITGFRQSFDEALFAPEQAGYTVAMQVSQFALVEPNWIGQDLARHPRLLHVIEAIQRFRPLIEPIIAEHPRLDSFLAQKAIFSNQGRRNYLHYMSGLCYGGDVLSLPSSDLNVHAFGLQRRPYVTVHNGYDPNMVVSHERATKCYPHFNEVVATLRRAYPGLTFVQVGIHTSAPIASADMNLIGKTTLQQVAGLLRGAVFHLDNEGGLVHLASAMGVRSCVVFGPTSSRYFGYPDNVNIDPGFCGGCWWITETWMNHCPRGFKTALCMTEQPAADVATAASRLVPAGLFTRLSEADKAAVAAHAAD